MNSTTASPDRGSTLVLIDDNGGGGGSSPIESRAGPITTTASSAIIVGSGVGSSSTMAQSSSFRPSSSTHPPDPLLYGLQTMEWRPWLRSPGSSSTIDEYVKNAAAVSNEDYSNYPTTKNGKNVRFDGDDEYATTRCDMHGVGPCRRSLRWYGKLFWTLLLLASTAGLAYELYKTVDEFLWATSTINSFTISKLSMQDGNGQINGIPFPDIYVCPTNPINETYRKRRRTDIRWFHLLSAMQQKSNSDGILGKLFVNWDYFTQPSAVISGPVAATNFTNNPWLSPDQSINQAPVLEDLSPMDPTPSPLHIDGMKEYFLRNGYETDAFLVECSFRSKNFKCSDVAQPILDRKHGKCFLFPFASGNTAWPQSLSSLSPTGIQNASWRVTHGGHGFSLAMNVHGELYPKENGSLYDGVYLYVDWKVDPASTSFRKPILLPPGAYSTISLQSKEIRTRTLWNSHCYDDDDDSTGRKGKHVWNVLNSPRYYSQDLCKFDCILQSIVDACGCLLLIDGRYVNRSALIIEHKAVNDSSDQQSQQSSSSTSTWSTIGYCTSEQLNECAHDILQQYDSPGANDYNTNNCTKKCRQSCHRNEYNLISNSFLKLPAESYLGSGPNYPYPWNELKNNFVILDVILEKGQTVYVEEKSSLNLEAFLGIVGGQMSLFLGCSLLTLIQVIVIFLSCCKKQCHRVYKGKCLTFRKTLRKMRHSSLLK